MSQDRTRRRQALRRQALLAAWLLAAGGLLARAVQVQLFESAEWRERAVVQHRQATEVPAPRGTIYDRDGVALAVSLERYLIEIDADLLTDRDSVRAALVEALGVSEREAERLTDPTRTWVTVPGRYEPSVRTALEGLQGVHLTRELRRDYPYRALSAGVLGHVIDDVGAGGIEQAFEDVLAGRPGRSVVARDADQKPIPGQVFEVRPPIAGGDVHLTLDLDLQEIAHQALTDALDETGARGGDLVVTDPHTGEVLAMVSIHGGTANSLSAINSPYEPGSTIKPFTVAALLQTGKARLSDPVEVGQGVWTHNGRTLSDVHVDSSTISLAGALRESSNVGIAKAALPLTQSEQYENLRDFGFGIPTGLGLPGEAGGLLRHPREWRPMSAQSLAVGYEMSATPLQLAMAYGALANGGKLMEARLVSRTRSPEGRERRFDPQVVRKVVDAGVTRELNEVLTAAVREGTATRASLESFDVAGKTGTTRVYSAEAGGYESGRYFASFIGYFPAEAPQLVIFVKLDSPSGGVYYGGATAAPVTRATMEAALAVRRSPLNRGELLDLSGRDIAGAGAYAGGRVSPASGAAPTPGSDPASGAASILGAARSSSPAPAVRFASTSPLDARLLPPEIEPEIEPESPAPARVAGAGPTTVTVPDVSDLPLRVAVRRLHSLGFRVRMEEGGDLFVSVPRAGDRSAPGDTIRIRIRPPRYGAPPSRARRPDR